MDRPFRSQLVDDLVLREIQNFIADKMNASGATFPFCFLALTAQGREKQLHQLSNVGSSPDLESSDAEGISRFLNHCMQILDEGYQLGDEEGN